MSSPNTAIWKVGRAMTEYCGLIDFSDEFWGKKMSFRDKLPPVSESPKEVCRGLDQRGSNIQEDNITIMAT